MALPTRPEVEERAKALRTSGTDEQGRSRATDGTVLPSHLNWINFFRAVPGLAEQFARAVPDNFYAREEVEGEDVLVISCPCGEEPFVLPGSSVICKCDRAYLGVGDGVRVANSPTPNESSDGSR